MYFFNLDINKKVSDFIIRKTREIYQNIKIETLKDCQILFLAEFDVYNSPNDNLLKVTKSIKTKRNYEKNSDKPLPLRSKLGYAILV